MLGLAGVDVAVPAGARARVAEDLEGRCPAAPALGDVRAPGLLADGDEAGAVQQLLDVEVLRVRARRANLHPRRPARPVGYWQRLHAEVSLDHVAERAVPVPLFRTSKGCDAAMSHPEAAPVPINPPSADCAVAAARAAVAASAVTQRIAALRRVHEPLRGWCRIRRSACSVRGSDGIPDPSCE